MERICVDTEKDLKRSSTSPVYEPDMSMKNKKRFGLALQSCQSKLASFSFQAQQNDIFLSKLNSSLELIGKEIEKDDSIDYSKLADEEKHILKMVEETEMISKKVKDILSDKSSEDDDKPLKICLEKCSSDLTSVADKIERYKQLQNSEAGIIVLKDI